MLIEERIRDFLLSELSEDNIGVYLETPQTLPQSFVVLQIAERDEENYINGVTMEFRSYAQSKYEAAILDEKVRNAMKTLHEGSDISAKLGGGNDSTDTALKMYRYRSYFNLYY